MGIQSAKRSAIVWASTPYDQQGHFDETGYRQQLKRLKGAGVDVFVGGPGLGGAHLADKPERDRLFAVAKDELKGSTKLVGGGREPRSASEMVDFLQAVERAGLDAANIYALELGHAARPTVAEMRLYYQTVIEATSLPVYLAFHHAAGYLPPLSLIEELLEKYPQVEGLTYGGSDLRFLANMISSFSSRTTIHCAGLFNAATTLVLGGHGFMGAEGNVVPKLFHSIISSYEASDPAALQENFRKLMIFHDIIVRYNGNSSSQRAVKPLMNALGQPGGSVKLPMLPIASQEVDAMLKEVMALNIPELATAA